VQSEGMRLFFFMMGLRSLSTTCSVHFLNINNGVHRCNRFIVNSTYDINLIGAYPNIFFTVASSLSGLNGFTIHPVAPARLPSTFLLSPTSVVNIKIGVNL